MKKPDFKSLIIHEDEDYILVNKPPFLSTLADRNDPIDLQTLAQEYNPEVKIGHRLDKETSGILVIAKHAEAYRHFSLQLEHRKAIKIYHAVVSGTHQLENYVINLPIHVLAKGGVKIDRRKGKPSKTIVTTLDIYKNHTLLACQPVTGRMHQIRIHLSAHKMAIIQDEFYHGKELFLSQLKRYYNLKKWTDELPLIKRVALHAFSMSFEGLNGQVISAEAAYPKDFAVLIKQLNKFK